jgi:hypothetical protein
MSDNTGTRVREFYLQWSQALTDTKASRLRDAAPRGEDWLSTLTFAFAEAYHAAQSLHSPACEEGVCKQCKDEEQSNLGAPGAGQAVWRSGIDACDSTSVRRFAQTCACPTYASNWGPCGGFEQGSNGRCVYCDHEKACCDNVKELAKLSGPGAGQAGTITYSCGHTLADPEAPQDAAWRGETPCPKCEGAGQAGSADIASYLALRLSDDTLRKSLSSDRDLLCADIRRLLRDVSVSLSEPKAAPETCPTCLSTDPNKRLCSHPELWHFPHEAVFLDCVKCSDPFHKAGSPDAR